jgi:hypothetical protein
MVPASAAAATRCVPNNSVASDCTGGPYAQPQLAANDANEDDTIRIAAGTYNSVDTAKVLNWIGAGSGSLASAAGATIIDAGATNVPALKLAGGGSVRDLQALGGASTNVPSSEGIKFVATGPGNFSLTAQDVVAIAGHVTGTSNPAAGFMSVAGPGSPEMKTTVIRGQFAGATDDTTGASQGLYLTASGGENIVSGVTAQGPTPTTGAGLSLVGGMSTTIERSLFQGDTAAGIDASSPVIRQSRFIGRTYGLAAFLGTNRNSNVTVEDSLLTANLPGMFTTAAAARISASDTATIALTARGSTFVAKGGVGGAVITEAAAPQYGPASASLRNSIARIEAPSDPAFAADLHAFSGGTITADFSAFSTRNEESGASAQVPGSASNVTGDPLFTNSAAGDFSLQPGSPLLDRGDASIVTAGELDLAGVARSLDGNGDCAARPDIGAFERPALACPAVANVPPNVSGFGQSNSVFAPVAKGGHITVARKKRKVKRGTRFRYTLSEAATVTITIERKLKGRRVKRGKKTVCAKPTRKNRRKRKCTRYKRAGTLKQSKPAGKQTTPFTGRFRGKALKRGAYRATLVAADAQGAKSTPRRVSFRIVKP